MSQAMTSPERPPVIWIGAQECTGCTESLLRATHPTLGKPCSGCYRTLNITKCSLPAFGYQAEENKHNAMNTKVKYVLCCRRFYPRQRWRYLLYGGRQTYS